VADQVYGCHATRYGTPFGKRPRRMLGRPKPVRPGDVRTVRSWWARGRRRSAA